MWWRKYKSLEKTKQNFISVGFLQFETRKWDQKKKNNPKFDVFLKSKWLAYINPALVNLQ